MKLYKYFILELIVTFMILSQYSPEHCIQCSDTRASKNITFQLAKILFKYLTQEMYFPP